MADFPAIDVRRRGPSDLVPSDVTPELLVCTALVRCGLVDGAGASIILTPEDRIALAATDGAFTEVAEMQFSTWEGPGPEVVETGHPVVVDDLRAQDARWPLTTPHAALTPMRALATLPLPSRHGLIGLFAAYRDTPRTFSSADLSQLESAAGTVGALADTRFDVLGSTVRAEAATLPVAVGMVMNRLGVDRDDALALLRARAFTLSVSAPALARELACGTTRIEDLLGPPDESWAPR